MEIRDVTVDDLVLDPNLNLRDRLDAETVDRYVDAWERMPPITVFDVDGRWLIADGFHRHASAIKLGRRTIPAEVREGTFEEALDFVAGSQPVPRPPAVPGRAPPGRRGQAPAPPRLVRPPDGRGPRHQPRPDRAGPQATGRLRPAPRLGHAGRLRRQDLPLGRPPPRPQRAPAPRQGDRPAGRPPRPRPVRGRPRPLGRRDLRPDARPSTTRPSTPPPPGTTHRPRPSPSPRRWPPPPRRSTRCSA